MDVIVYVLCGIACLIQSWGKNTVEEPSIMVIVRIVNSIAIFVWSVFTPSPIEEIVGGAVNFRPAAYLCFISELVYFPEALTQMVGTGSVSNPHMAAVLNDISPFHQQYGGIFQRTFRISYVILPCNTMHSQPLEIVAQLGSGGRRRRVC